jgi:inner membrane protein involved in colicin E2 resistance
MKQRLIFFLLTIEAIMAADLTISLINKYIMTYKDKIGLHYMTLIGMGVVLVFFYILVKNISRLSDWTVRTFVSVSRAYLGRSIGLYLAIAAVFGILYEGYYWAWFDRFFHREAIAWIRMMVGKL